MDVLTHAHAPALNTRLRLYWNFVDLSGSGSFQPIAFEPEGLPQCGLVTTQLSNFNGVVAGLLDVFEFTFGRVANARLVWQRASSVPAERDFFCFIPFWAGWEKGFFERERFFSRVSAKNFIWVFFWCFLVFLLFFGGVFVLFFVFFCFSRVSAIFFWFFFGGGVSKTGNSRSEYLCLSVCGNASISKQRRARPQAVSLIMRQLGIGPNRLSLTRSRGRSRSG